MKVSYGDISRHRRFNANWGLVARKATLGRNGPWKGALTVDFNTIYDAPWYIDSWSITARYEQASDLPKETIRLMDGIDAMMMARKMVKTLSPKYLKEVARNVGYDVI